MKIKLKKALSLLMTLAIVCSFAVVPASAEAGAAKLVLESDGWSGDTYVVDVYVESSEGSGVVGFAADIEFDSALMSCESIENIPGQYAVVLTANPKAGDGMASVSAAGTTETALVDGRLGLFRLTFKVAANAEKAEATVTVTSDDISADRGEAYEVTAGTITDIVPGLKPAVDSLELAEPNVEVDGKTDVNIDVTVKKADGTEVVLGDGELDIKPANKGVSYSGGKVVVEKDAEAGTYTFTVDNGNPGSKGTATLTVTRAGVGEIVEVEISGGNTITLSGGSAAYSAKAKDIWGTSIVADINWTLGGEDADAAELSSKTSQTGKAITVKLTEKAEEGDTFTLTAENTGKDDSDTITIKVVKGVVNAKAEKWTGDDGSVIYIPIEDIDRVNSIGALRLDDVFPTKVQVTYPDGEKDYDSSFKVRWDWTALWDEFKTLRKNWSSIDSVKKYGRVVLNPADFLDLEKMDTAPVVIDFSGWFSIVIDEGSAEASGWYEEPSAYVPPVPSANFTDVAAGYWAAEDINWCYANKVMLGNSETTFNPTGVTSRQQLWMVLARVNGSAPDSMATARIWSINMGVSDGSNVSGALTRQQMVTMLYRYSNIKGYAGKAGTGLSGFADAGSVSGYAREAMSWAVANGIITGNDGRLNPNGTATRAQFAAIMHRFCDTFKVI